MSDRIVYVTDTYESLANRLNNLHSELDSLAAQLGVYAAGSAARSALNLGITGVFSLNRIGKAYQYGNAAAALTSAALALRSCGDDARDLAKSLDEIRELMEKNETHVIALIFGQLDALLEEEAKQEREENANFWRGVLTGAVVIVSVVVTVATAGAATPVTAFAIGAVTSGSLSLINSAADQYIENGEVDGWQLVYDTTTGALIGGFSNMAGFCAGQAVSGAIMNTSYVQGLLQGGKFSQWAAFALTGTGGSVVEGVATRAVESAGSQIAHGEFDIGKVASDTFSAKDIVIDTVSGVASASIEYVAENRHVDMKTREDCIGPDGKTAWTESSVPGTQKEITLKPGDTVQRVGDPDGHFMAPEGQSIADSALPYDPDTATVHKYEVVGNIKAEQSVVANQPNFPGKNGGGTQFVTEKSVSKLISEGSLREVIDIPGRVSGSAMNNTYDWLHDGEVR